MTYLNVFFLGLELFHSKLMAKINITSTTIHIYNVSKLVCAIDLVVLNPNSVGVKYSLIV